jgi:hypothetical protein
MSLATLYKYNTTAVLTPDLIVKQLTPISTNPSVAMNMYIAIFRPDGTTGNVDYRFNVELWFDTELYGINTLSTS